MVVFVRELLSGPRRLFSFSPRSCSVVLLGTPGRALLAPVCVPIRAVSVAPTQSELSLSMSCVAPTRASLESLRELLSVVYPVQHVFHASWHCRGGAVPHSSREPPAARFGRVAGSSIREHRPAAFQRRLVVLTRGLDA